MGAYNRLSRREVLVAVSWQDFEPINNHVLQYLLGIEFRNGQRPLYWWKNENACGGSSCGVTIQH
jgi:hypothetical protein